MTSKTLVASCVATYCSLAAVTAVWSLGSVLDSRPATPGRVLGISTETEVVKAEAGNTFSDSSLAPYPSITVPNSVKAASRQFALYHVESGKVLARSSDMDQVPIASTTKLMTAYLVDKHLSYDQQVTISREAANQIGSRMGLRAGSTLTVEALMYGLLMVSGNDAAYALAEAVGATQTSSTETLKSSEAVEVFVNMMNSTAGEFTLTETRYLDPAGLNDKGLSTAVDLAKITSIVNKQSRLASIMGTAEITVTTANGGQRFNLRNSNRMTTEYQFNGSIGGKTGFTPAAGHCLVSSATRNGNTLVAVILSTYDTSNDASARAARSLLTAGFEQLRVE